jgi:peroxiredoxin
MFAFLASAAVGIGGGRFVSYTMRGTLNPPINLALTTGDRFPDFELPDQNGRLYQRPINATALILIYRGDFCPFSRYELAELTTRSAEFRQRGIRMLAISADPAERSKMLAAFLHTDIPLLSDVRESLLGPLGLIQHHRNKVPDNALPAFFLLDRSGVVRWIFTSPYYREQPSADSLLEQAAAINR